MDVERLAPMEGKFIVKRKEFSHTTKGGIFIPESHREESSEGLIIAGANDQLKPGDSVLFTCYSGTETVINDQELLVIDEADILAKVTDEKVA